jgi:integrase
MKKSIVDSGHIAESNSVSPIYARDGRRKYLTQEERAAFLKAVLLLPDEPRLFCSVLAYTGARISEALALTPSQIDFEGGLVVFESLKKRKKGYFRAIPIPNGLLADIERVLHVRNAQRTHTRASERIWSCGRTTAWKWVRAAMELAGIERIRGTARGLRHTFAVTALQAGVPITLVRKWMGHARISTTEIYADVVGNEEREFARKLWIGTGNE